MTTALKDRLIEAVKRKGVSVTQARADLQRLTGMSRSNMTHWFTGRTSSPSTAAAVIAADYFEVDLLWLTLGKGSPRPGKEATKIGAQTMALPRGWKRENVLRLLEIAEKFDAATLEIWCDQR